MEPAAAIMLFLSCSTGSTDCREIRDLRAYDSAASCREALPAVLRSMNMSDRHVTGRCVLASDFNLGVDPLTTASIPSASASPDGYAMVRVTRVNDGQREVTSYRVPQARDLPRRFQ